jgi:hypothetical protein
MRTFVMDGPRHDGDGTCGPRRGFLEDDGDDGAADDEGVDVSTEQDDVRKQRVKNDIYHAFQRFRRTLRKEHGAYQDFISALRDATFILNLDDVDECTHVLSEKHGMPEEEVKTKMEHDFDRFLHRARHLVPTSPEIEKRDMAIHQAFKDRRLALRRSIRGTSAVERLCLPGITPAPLRISKKRKSTWNYEVAHGTISLVRNDAVVS